MKDKIHVVIAAAGSSRRMGKAAAVNKPYLALSGRPVLAHSIAFFEKNPQVAEIVITASPEEVDYCKKEVVGRYGFQKVTAVVPGGKERQDSVFRGLLALNAETARWVAVHDGARPFLNETLFEALLQSVQQHHAAIPGVLVKDTIKQVDENGRVELTPERSRLRAIQTPQLFDFPELLTAYQKAQQEGFPATDDAMLYERYIGRVQVVDTLWDNLKITTPEDWEWAQYRAGQQMRLQKEE